MKNNNLTPSFIKEVDFKDKNFNLNAENIPKYAQIFALNDSNICKRICIHVEACLDNLKFAKSCNTRKNRGNFLKRLNTRESYLQAADKCSTKILQDGGHLNEDIPV